MPRVLKRRAEAISRNDDNESSSESNEETAERRPAQRSTQQQQRRQRRRSTPPSNVSQSDSDPEVPSADENESAVIDVKSLTNDLIKKLVRLALSCEYARQPLKRADILAKILKGEGAGTGTKGINFKTVFNGAQKTLREVFGMELVDLPGRERVGLNERRKAASQKATQKEATQKPRAQRELNGEDDNAQSRNTVKDPVLSATSWILVSTLPMAYRTRPELFVPSRAPDADTEATYTALCTIIVSIIYLHTPSGSSDANEKDKSQLQSDAPDNDATEPISDAKLVRYISRLGLQDWAPISTGTTTAMTIDKFLARMIREGYIDKRRDDSAGEETIEWVVGPRGKREIGRQGVAGLVRGVYGFGVDGSGKGLERPQAPGEDDEDDEPDNGENSQQRRRPVKMERDELERRLKRTLGDVVALKISEREANGEAIEADDQNEPQQQQQERTEDGNRRRNRNGTRNQEQTDARAPRRSTRRRGAANDDDDDDE